MKIHEHRLLGAESDAIRSVPSPNLGGDLDPRYIVIHYTAGPSAESSVNWLANPAARASAHLVIGRDGSIVQLIPFDRVAWHAGPSRWEGLVGLNRHAIGIELDNAGRLERKGGTWCAWFGAPYQEEDLMVAKHKHEARECGWHLYTPPQLETALAVCRMLVGQYPVRDVVGHDDISPGRKWDPGPAFPMGSFRAHLFGRAEDRLPSFRTRTALNIRTGPGTQHERLPESPLAPDTRLEVLDEARDWRFVNVVGTPDPGADVEGWVHGAFIERIE